MGLSPLHSYRTAYFGESKQGIFSSGNGNKYFPIAFPDAVLGVAFSIGHGASDPAFYSALTKSYVAITDAKGAVSVIVVGR